MCCSRNYKTALFGFCGAVAILLVVGGAWAQSSEESLVKDMCWRNIGPANMSGRISDIEALEDDWTTVVVASASGGVWKSTNGGNTFEPIFDRYGALMSVDEPREYVVECRFAGSGADGNDDIAPRDHGSFQEFDHIFAYRPKP